MNRRNRLLLAVAWVLAFILSLVIVGALSAQDKPAPAGATDKVLSVDAQNKILRLENRQLEIAQQSVELQNQFKAISTEYNSINGQIDKIEKDELQGMAMAPEKFYIDDGRQPEPPGSAHSQKTFKITAKVEPPKPPTPTTPAAPTQPKGK
jgi:hypothetical protein